MVEKVAVFLKERWWLILIVAVILVLLLIPTQSGLPDSEYQGCEVKDSVCQTSTIKSVTKESDGSTTLVVPVKTGDTETQDLSFHLSQFNSDWAAGNTIFMNFTPDNHKVYLFIGYRSNLFMTLLWQALSASQGSTAVVDTNTGQQIQGQ